MRTLTLRRAIVLAVVVGLVIPALMISGFSWFKRYDEDVQKRTNEFLQQNADVLANAMQEPLWNVNQDSASALLDVIMRNEDIVRIEVRDNVLGVFVSRDRPERRSGYMASTKKTVTFRGNTIGSIMIEVGSARLHRNMIEDLIQYMIALGAQIALSIVLIMILLEKRLVGPLQRLGAGAERLARRQLDMPFTWKRLDEIGLFSQRLEATRISLRNLFDELGQKNRELELDIDKRKRIEQELHERETRFRVLVEQSPIAIIEWDINYQVIEWNAAAEQIFGYPRSAALGQHASMIIPNATPELLNKIFHKLSKGKDNVYSVTQNRRADGSIIVCQWRNAYIADKPGHAGRLLSMAEDITEKRRAEEAQRLSEAKFAGAFQCNPDPVSITRLSDGVLLDVNQTFEKITGYHRNESVGKTDIELNIWADPQERHALIGQLGKDQIVRNFSWSMRTKYGEIRKCLSNSTIFTVGDELYMLAVIRDVTDQRLLEEQKAEADRALLRLAQGTQDIAGEAFLELLVADLASALRTDSAFIALRSVETPDRLQTIAAHARGQLVQDFDYVISGSPCEPVLAGDICVFPSNAQVLFPEDKALVAEGWNSCAGAPIRDAGGNTIGVFAVMHSQFLGNADLVKSLLRVFSERASAELERKRAEEALRNSQQQFAAMFHASPVSMSLARFGDEYMIVDANKAFERLYICSRIDAIGRDALDPTAYCDPADRGSIIDILQRTGHIDRFETWMILGDGSRALIQLSGNVFELGGEQFVILTGEDVTEKHHIENEILELNANLEERVIKRTDELQQANQELATTLETLNMAQEELVRSEKLAALGSLVAGIAHELNTPIGNSLMVASTLVDRTRAFNDSYANGLKRSVLESYIADTNKAGDILVRNLYRAADLVTSFKRVAVDQTSSQRRSFSLSEVISEIILTLSPTIRKTAFIVTQDIPDDILMDSYPGPLGQVITNMVNNALLHGFEDRSSGTVTINAQPTMEGWVELIIKDDGVGIPASNLNRIFDPFFTTKLGAGGSGLGLNITHNIVTSVLGGRIRVQSEVGVGTIFILTLPTAAPQRESDEVVATSAT
jgi:PAS domain S-box-containing protein